MANWLLDEESGQGVAEYMLILVLILFVAFMTAEKVGEKVISLFDVIWNKFTHL